MRLSKLTNPLAELHLRIQVADCLPDWIIVCCVYFLVNQVAGLMLKDRIVVATALVAPPEQGQLVSVRSRNWIVNEVAPSTLPKTHTISRISGMRSNLPISITRPFVSVPYGIDG